MLRTAFVRSLTATALSCGITAALFATDAAAGPAPETHDGVMIRLAPGFSGAASVNTIGDEDATLSGPAGMFGLEIGYSLTRNLSIGVDLMSHMVLGPELEVGDTTSSTDDDVEWGVHYLGVAANYYLPMNLYFKGGVGAMMMTLRAPGMEDAESEVGFGAQIGLGKEWWVSPNWGIGVATQLLVGSVPDGDEEVDDWTTAAFGIMMSATYN